MVVCIYCFNLKNFVIFYTIHITLSNPHTHTHTVFSPSFFAICFRSASSYGGDGCIFFSMAASTRAWSMLETVGRPHGHSSSSGSCCMIISASAAAHSRITKMYKFHHIFLHSICDAREHIICHSGHNHTKCGTEFSVCSSRFHQQMAQNICTLWLPWDPYAILFIQPSEIFVTLKSFSIEIFFNPGLSLSKTNFRVTFLIYSFILHPFSPLHSVNWTHSPRIRCSLLPYAMSAR